MTKKANIGKRRNVHKTNIDSNDVDYPTDVIDYMIFSSMLVLGMIRPKRPTEAKEGMSIKSI